MLGRSPLPTRRLREPHQSRNCGALRISSPSQDLGGWLVAAAANPSKPFTSLRYVLAAVCAPPTPSNNRTRRQRCCHGHGAWTLPPAPAISPCALSCPFRPACDCHPVPAPVEEPPGTQVLEMWREHSPGGTASGLPSFYLLPKDGATGPALAAAHPVCPTPRWGSRGVLFPG